MIPGILPGFSHSFGPTIVAAATGSAVLRDLEGHTLHDLSGKSLKP